MGGSTEVGDGELEDGMAALRLEEEIRRRKGMMSPSLRDQMKGPTGVIIGSFQ